MENRQTMMFGATFPDGSLPRWQGCTLDGALQDDPSQTCDQADASPFQVNDEHINLAIEAGETLFWKCREDSLFGCTWATFLKQAAWQTKTCPKHLHQLRI